MTERMEEKQAIIIGGGAAGLSAATALHEEGVRDLLIVEREPGLGGILQQCIHDGFGLEKFNLSLTGPEYGQRYIERVDELGISCLVDSMVLELTPDRELLVANREGLHRYRARAVILAMGCRERTRGAIGIPGSRPAGIYTAGVAQNLINMHNYMPGRSVIVLGSGDVGLIMARRMLIEGARVKMVIEKLPYPSGLPRNVNQCLYDFDIPLLLGHTVTEIHGGDRISAVTVGELDEQGEIVSASEQKVPCDTLLLSVGLIPENELSRSAGVEIDERTGGPRVDELGQTSVPGIFACGNVLHVHDIVDYVSLEAEHVARGVIEYLQEKRRTRSRLEVTAGKGIDYILPQELGTVRNTVFSLRASRPGQRQTLIFTSDSRTLREVPLKRVNPAEMIRVEVAGHKLRGAKNLHARLIP